MEEKVIDINLEISSETTGQLETEFINKVRELDIAEIEPLLTEEDVIFHSLEKYQFLIMLKDLFLEFKRLGDTQIIVEKGGCGSNCGRITDTVYQLKGNNSKQTIFLGVDKEEGNLKFHGCMHFVDKFGKKGENWQRLTVFAALAMQRIEKSTKES